jgi:hypothetical protein
LKKGIQASELRPFSMEDPFGLGIETPSQKRLHERFHRTVFRKLTPGKTPQERASAARPLARERRPAPVQTAAAQALAPAQNAPAQKSSSQNSSEKKGCGWGCLTTLVILGALWAVGQIFVPLIVAAIEQEVVSHTGKSGYGRILKATPRDISLNESTVYELTVEVHAAGRPPYQVNFEQALEPAQAKAAQIGAWTTLHFDESDPNSIVLERLGIDPPSPEAILKAGAPDVGAPSDSTRGFKFDVRATASVSTGAPTAPNPTAPDSPSAPSPTASAPTSGSPTTSAPASDDAAASSGAKKASGAAPHPTQAPAPAPDRPASADPPSGPSVSTSSASTPSAAPPPSPPQPSEVVLPACRRAAACCTLAGGQGCGQFAVPGKEKRECTRAFNSFNKQATAAGKPCQ